MLAFEDGGADPVYVSLIEAGEAGTVEHADLNLAKLVTCARSVFDKLGVGEPGKVSDIIGTER